MNPKTAKSLALLLLMLHAGLLAWSDWVHAPVYDEPGHLTAGLRILTSGDFSVYRVNPPLVKVLAAWPVLLARPVLDWSHYEIGTSVRPEFMLGMDFIAANGPRSFWYITLARLSCIPLSLLGGIICYLWATRLYGHASGLVAMMLWCTCPNVLALGATITPDLGAASLGVTASYAFWRWLGSAGWRHAVWCGLSLGLAVLVKSSWITLFALWPALWYFRAMLSRDVGPGQQRPRFPPLVAAMGIAFYTINLGYGFEGTLRPLKEFTFVSQTLAGAASKVEHGVGGNRFANTILRDVPVPLPANFVLGIDLQKSDFESGLESYLNGRWSDRGWWYYYIIAAVYKIPLGTWLLLGLVVLRRAARFSGHRKAGPREPAPPKNRPGAWSDEVILLAPAVMMFVLVSSQSGISRNFRYALPCFPFLFIYAGQSGALIRTSRPWWGACVLGAIVWTSISSLSVYPHSLSYFNELAGGPEGGHRHLIDTNIDWGQDLLYLKCWYDKHPEARPLRAALYGHHFDVNQVGIEFSSPHPGPATGRDSAASLRKDESVLGPQPGWYAMSVHRLHDRDGKYDYFLRYFEPKFKIGYSIYIYHIMPEEANRVRAALGLQEL